MKFNQSLLLAKHKIVTSQFFRKFFYKTYGGGDLNCIIYCLKHYFPESNFKRRNILKILPRPIGGYSMLDMQNIFSEFGLNSRVLACKARDIEFLNRPAILFWKAEQFVVVGDISENGINIQLDKFGKKRYMFSHFRRYYSNIALELELNNFNAGKE